MSKTKQFLISLTISFVIFLMLIMPAVSLAVNTPLVTCTDGKVCGFNELMALVNRVIQFILFDMALPIAAIMFIYAGFLMITAGGEAAGARTKAKSIFTNAVLGLVFAAAAW